MPQDDPFKACGGYMNVKISKLENQVANSNNIYKQSNLFDGISIFVNGWTNPTADDLKRIMMTYGGTYHHYERKHTTFIIAENLPDVKLRNMNTSNVIKPKWVVDCIKANKILDYSNYLLYTNQKRSQPGLFFKNMYNDESIYPSRNEKKPIDTNLKRKFDLITDENELSSAPKSKIRTDTISDNSDSENDDINDIETDCNIVNEGKFLHDPSVALEILNNQITNKTEYRTEKDFNQKKTTEPNTINSKTRTANDPKFLSEFYNNSRLHHIATLGAGFKQYVTELRESHSGEFPLRNELIRNLNKKNNFINTPFVMHIDMDCFFVSVGLRTHPHLKGCPVAVTHSKGGAEVADRPGVDREQELSLYMKRLENRLQENIVNDKKDKIKNGFDGKESLSEIASCSYEARKNGVKNGMFVGQALKLCPDLKTIPYDFEGYKEVAFQLYDTIAQYTLDMEAVSCDEMFVDLTSLLNDIKVDVMDFVTYVREEVRVKTKCPCSAGVGGNRLQARMATKKAKPDGQYLLDPNTILEYMANIPIKSLPGVGYSTDCALKQLNWETCGDLQNVSLAKLQMEFGKKFGETLYQSCRGIDSKPLVFGQIRKSVSAEVNYGIRFTDNSELEKFLRQLCEEVHSRLMNIKRKGKCITLKVMIRAKEAPLETAKFMGHGFCDSMNKSVSLSDYTCDLETITRTVLTTMKALNLPPKELRGLGIQISKLDDPNDAKKANIIKNMFNKVIEKQKDKISAATNNNQYADSINKTPEKQKVINCNENQGIQAKNKAPKNSPNDVAQKTFKTPEKTNMLKGRGKQSKTKTNTAVKPNGTILSMFQNAAKQTNKPSSTITSSINTNVYQANEIDPNVLAELPEEIQREILKENRISIENISSPTDKSKSLNHTPNNIDENIEMIIDDEPNNNKPTYDSKKIEVDIEFLNALPENLRLELEKEIKESKEKYLIVNKNNCNNIKADLLTKFNCNNNFTEIEPNQNDLAEAGPSTSSTNKSSELTIEILQHNPTKYIKNWINCTNRPAKKEIIKFCNDVKDCIKLDCMTNVNDIIGELYKIINQMENCQWHTAFKLIIENLQEEIKSTTSGIFLNYIVDCDDCS